MCTRFLILAALVCLLTAFSIAQGPPPSITGSSPTKGPVGTVVTISGSAFDVSAVVRLNGAQCTVESNTGSSIRCIVPTGASSGTITVVSGGQIAVSPDSFIVSPNGIIQVPNVDSSTARQVVLMDLVGDQMDDPATLIESQYDGETHWFIVARPHSKTADVPMPVITVVPGGDRMRPVIAPFTYLGGPRQGLYLLTHDAGTGLNGTPNRFSITVLEPDTTVPGSFTARTRYKMFSITGSAEPVGRMAVGDLNGDGATDLVCLTSSATGDSLQIFAGNPDGTLAPAIAIDEPGVHITDLCIASKDGAISPPDIFCATSTGVDRFVNNGSFSFTRQAGIVTVDGTTRLACADIDHDGSGDLVCLSSTLGTVTGILLSPSCTETGRGVYTATTPLADCLAVCDLDNDGAAEIAIDEQGVHRSITFLRWGGGGSGGVAGFRDIQVGEVCDDGNERVFGAGDVDGDGFPDIAVAACSSSFTVLPKVTSFSPRSGSIGTVITVTGQHLDAVTSVTLGGVACPITSHSSSSLTFTSKSSGHAVEKIEIAVEKIERARTLQTFSSEPNLIQAQPQVDAAVTRQAFAVDVTGDSLPEVVEVIEYRNGDDPITHKRSTIALACRIADAGQVTETTTKIAESDSAGAIVRVAAGDLDGDGKPEFAIINRGPRQTVSLDGTYSHRESGNWLTIVSSDPAHPGAFRRSHQTSDGSTSQWPLFRVGSLSPRSDIAIGDVDGDGYPDICFTTTGPDGDSLFIWYNDPTSPGDFAKYKLQSGFIYATAPAGGSPRMVCPTGASNGGGGVVMTSDSGLVLYRERVGRANSSVTILDIAGRYAWTCVGDFDGDGKQDIAGIDADSSFIHVFHGSKDGAFLPPEITRPVYSGRNPWRGTFSSGAGWSNRTTGRSGIVLAEPGSPYAFTIFQGEVGGLEPDYRDEDCNGSSDDRVVAVGDLNGDTYPDVVIGSCSNSVIFPPLVVNFSPVIGPRGSILEMTGRHLASLTAQTCGSNPCTIVSKTDSVIKTRPLVATGTFSDGRARGVIVTAIDQYGNRVADADPITITPSNLLSLPRIDSALDRSMYIVDLDRDGHPDAVELIAQGGALDTGLIVAVHRGDGVGGVVKSTVKNPQPRPHVQGHIQVGGAALVVPPDPSGPHSEGAPLMGVIAWNVDRTGPELQAFRFDSVTLNPERTFTRQLSAASPGDARVACADLNGDGRADLIVSAAGNETDSLLVFGQAGGGQFIEVFHQGVLRSSGGGAVRSIRVSEARPQSPRERFFVARDSIIEVYGDPDVPGDMKVTFTVDTQGPIVDFAVADLDGDGLTDIAVLQGDNHVSIFTQVSSSGGHSFEKKGSVALESAQHPVSVRCTDFDRDGVADLVLFSATGSEVCALRGIPASDAQDLPPHNFVVALDDVSPDDRISVAAGDVNGDGYTDFVASSSSGTAVSAPLLSLDGHDFGEVVLGDSAATQITVSNLGGVAATGVTVDIAGTDANAFQIRTSPPSTLSPQSSFSLAVSYRPVHRGRTTDTLKINAVETNFAVLLSGLGADTGSYRSFSVDSIITTVNEAGKAMTAVKSKPNVVEFAAHMAVDEGANGLYIEFGSPIDTTFPFTTLPPSASASGDTKLKKWHFAFSSPMHAGDSVIVLGTGKGGKPQKVSKFSTEIDGVLVGGFKKTAVFSLNQPRAFMPNRVNTFDAVFSSKILASTGNLLIVGEPNPDSAKQYGWLAAKTSKDVLKSFFEKGDTPTQNQFRPFDTFSSGKPINGKQGSLAVSKFSSRLLCELIALKVNIDASDAGICPPGFGDLIFDDSEGNEYNGYSVRAIAAIGDSMMMGHYDANLRTRINELESKLQAFGLLARRINGAFEGTLDTAKFIGGLQWTSSRSLADVPFLHHAVGGSRPLQLARSGAVVPDAYALYQNYPNPFNPSTTVSFSLARPSIVTVKVYNLLGQVVATLVDHAGMEEGMHEQLFNAANLASGVYFYRLTAQPVDEEGAHAGALFTNIGKMMLVK